MKPMPGLIPRFNLDYNFDDFTTGIKSIFANGEYDFSRLESIFNTNHFFFTNSGRSSLYIILKSLNLPPGSKIGVPLYSCTVVFDAIVNAGFVPCFIDIDDNYTIDPDDLQEKVEDLEAVVVIHTFGRPADMDRIMDAAGDIPIIEDCAHSLLSEYKGKITGTMGAASFFSFRSGKYISAGEGGMIVLNNGQLNDTIKREVDLLKMPSTLDEIKHSFLVYIKSALYHKPWFGVFSLPIGSLVDAKLDVMSKWGFDTYKTRKSDLKVILKKMGTFREYVEMQRRNSRFLLSELEGITSIKIPHEPPDTYCNYYLFPIVFENEERRDKASDRFRNVGIDTTKLYHTTPAIAERMYGYTGGCPNTEELAKTILTLPNYYTLTENDLIKIVDSTKRVGELL